MENILREVISNDKSILTQRDRLIEILDAKVPDNLALEYSTLKTALQLNIGEIFASSDISLEEKKAEAVKKMTEAGMQQECIDDVINILVKVLDLDKPKINIKKVKLNKFQKPPQEESEVETTNLENNNINSKALVKLEKPVQTEEDREEVIVEETVQEENNFKNFNNFNNFNNFRNTTINAPVNQLDKIFTTQGRINRQTYLIMGLKLFVLAFIGSLIGKWGLPLVIVAAVGNIMISIRRLHDLNRSGWFMLIFCIPYVDILFGLYLLFFKGTNGYNKYGSDPLINS